MRLIVPILYLLCLFNRLESSETKKKVCLNMIVKDETKVIRRALASVKPIIDYWVIVDTGSSDGTQQMIREFLKDVPGELHERPWKNFEHNRNQALELAKGKADYILLMDADEVLEYTPDFKLPTLSKDIYHSVIYDGGACYNRPLLVKEQLGWKWHGVLHEYIDSPNKRNDELLGGLTKISNREGARSNDPKKYEKDAKVLEEALKEDPTNSRYMFYLAKSYRDAKDYPNALKSYENRVKMKGWDEEVYYSMLEIAKVQQWMGMKPEVIIKSYTAAYHFRPKRAEPLYYLAQYFRLKEDYKRAYHFASLGLSIPMPNDLLFIDKWVYDYDMQHEVAISAYYIGKYEESQKHFQALLENPTLPKSMVELVTTNLSFANAKLAEKSALEASVKD